MKGSTQVKSQMPAPNVTRNLTRIHKVEKPFPFSKCDNVFNQRAHLNTHIRTHSGEKWRDTQQMLTWRNIKGSTQVNSHMPAPYVKRHLTWGCFIFHAKKWNHLHPYSYKCYQQCIISIFSHRIWIKKLIKYIADNTCRNRDVDGSTFWHEK